MMAEAFAHSLAASKQLTIYKSIVFSCKPFSIKAACNYVCNIKKLNSNIEQIDSLKYEQSVLVKDNICRCFASLKQVNQFIEHVQGLAKTTYDPTLPTHTALLTQLWKGLMPSNRVPELSNSDDWGLIGFQGKDPSTDFRGLGMLGLMQLQWFATHYDDGTDARKVLSEANHDTRYFPMCATGINISYLCLEMLRESRLHRLLFECIAVETLISDNKTQTECGDKVVDLCPNESNHETASLLSAQLCDTYGTSGAFSLSPTLVLRKRYHEFYCETYVAWTKFWVSMNPKDIMAFPALFKEFSTALRKLYDKL